MKTIIAALDGSDPALHAATKAAEMARALGRGWCWPRW